MCDLVTFLTNICKSQGERDWGTAGNTLGTLGWHAVCVECIEYQAKLDNCPNNKHKFFAQVVWFFSST